jgi:hypothetical protein
MLEESEIVSKYSVATETKSYLYTFIFSPCSFGSVADSVYVSVFVFVVSKYLDVG